MTIEEYNKTVDLYSDRVFRFVLKICNDQHKAEDIVQDSYEKLWKNFEAVNFLKSRAYLFTTAYHTLIDRLRKENRMIKSEGIILSDTGYEQSYSDLKEVLNHAVKQLPEIQRMVLLLRDYEGYSYKEIGDLTALNESQVKVYIYRARVFLKNYIRKIDVLV